MVNRITPEARKMRVGQRLMSGQRERGGTRLCRRGGG